MIEQGLVHIYYGDGKGKTTAAMGLALRCAGHGGRVVIVQFLKDGASGECNILKTLPQVSMLNCNPYGKFSFRMNGEEREYTADAMQQCFAEALEQAKDARMLILDEAITAITCGFLTEEQILDMIQQRPQTLEIVLTGRYPTQELLAQADYASEIRGVKHPYGLGVAARDGIER